MTDSSILTITLLPKTPTQKGEYASKEVNLIDEGISVIPMHLFTTFRNVTALNLSQNDLKMLPDAIGECVQLRFLRLTCNQLEHVPESIRKCIRLEVLNLWDNRLSTLPESIGELQCLTELNVSLNRLDSIPNTLIDCKNLRVLEARNNQFKFVPDVFAKLMEAKVFIYFDE